MTDRGDFVLPLSDSFNEVKTLGNIVILGLEEGWSDDSARDRLYINFLKSELQLDINLALVNQRDGRTCKPSLLANDI